MNISVLLEGGVGDLILSTRFIGAIREKYPDAHITAYFNNENNAVFADFIKTHWGYLFDDSVHVERVSDNHQIISQFGQETHNAAFQNITPEGQRLILSADKFYNLHLDGLHFLRYRDIPWQKYFKFTPIPKNLAPVEDLPRKFIAVNLFARQGHFSGVSKEKSDELINRLRENNDLVIIAPNQEAADTFYKGQDDVRVLSLSESLTVASKSEIGLSIDTGVRCMFAPFGKPCYTLTGHAKQAFQVPPSHILRWYQSVEQMLPPNLDNQDIVRLVENGVESPVSVFFPTVPLEHLDNFLVNRKY